MRLKDKVAIITGSGSGIGKAADKLIIKNVGAYNISQSSSFIFPRPPVILVEDGQIRVLRRPETVSDIFSFEKL